MKHDTFINIVVYVFVMRLVYSGADQLRVTGFCAGVSPVTGEFPMGQ